MKKLIWIYTAVFLTIFFGPGKLSAQQIILDRPVRAGELTLFPEVKDQNKFYYVLDKARLATDESEKPKFSFLRYVDNESNNDRTTSLTEATGGGILHAMVTLEVTRDQIQDAEMDLRTIYPNASIEGPVIFKSGRFALITSFTEDNGELTKRLIGTGSAPILDGQKAAVSMFLTKMGSQLLWESFKTATPDISFSFEMTLEGYRLPKQAIVEANFEDIYKSFDLGLQAGYTVGGGSGGGDSSKKSDSKKSDSKKDGQSAGVFLGADIKYSFEELRKSGAIKVEQFGDDDDLDALVTAAYNKLADLMFDKIETSSNNNSQNGMDPTKFISQLAESQKKEDSSPLNGVMFSFKMKKQRRTGTFRFDFNKWTNDEIVMRFDENVGELNRYQNDPDVFRQINLDDPIYQQREVLAMIDGYNAVDFGTYINFVNVHLRKEHAEGHITDREIRIDRTNFNQTGNAFSMMYGWHGDNDRRKWMDYKYEVLWSFFGDVEVKQDFIPTTFNTINLAPPYQKHEVEIEADPSMLEEQDVRMVKVKLFYKVEDKEFTKQATLITSRDNLSQKLEYISLPSSLEYDYEITWRLKGNKTITSGRQTSSDSLLFVDELPSSEN